jgi:hypothetical protein
MPFQFDFPASLTTEKFISSLSDKASIELVSRQYFLKTYYDSFDWRLYKKDITLANLTVQMQHPLCY